LRDQSATGEPVPARSASNAETVLLAVAMNTTLCVPPAIDRFDA
jgi:hypothetical protein